MSDNDNEDFWIDVDEFILGCYATQGCAPTPEELSEEFAMTSEEATRIILEYNKG